MKHNDGTWQVYYEDRLVIRWKQKRHPYNVRFQGKRVTNSCPLAYKYRRIYVKDGIVKCVAALRNDNPGMLISDAVALIRKAQ